MTMPSKSSLCWSISQSADRPLRVDRTLQRRSRSARPPRGQLVFWGCKVWYIALPTANQRSQRLDWTKQSSSSRTRSVSAKSRSWSSRLISQCFPLWRIPCQNSPASQNLADTGLGLEFLIVQISQFLHHK